MTFPLLTTRIHPPPSRPDLVPRPHLLKRIDSATRRKLTLISAPAGFGKTTLLRAWIDSTDLPVAWVSLDDDDNIPSRFWMYVLAALRVVWQGLGDSVFEALQTPHPPPLETLVVELINEITADQSPLGHAAGPEISLALILDDYHAINNRQIHDTVTFFIDHLPPQIHMLIASRSDPPWPLARLRAGNVITELRTDDLRFTAPEISTLFNQVMRFNIAPEDVTALEKRTEGWVVGLQMASISMQKRNDISDFIRAFTGTNRFILDYLLEEVLDQQSSDVRSFLLKTSILEQLSGELCDFVLDCSDSQMTLMRLEKANLFLIPLDDVRHWYRYHHLFAELLRNQLAQIAPEQVSGLHLRASQWYEMQAIIPKAIQHAFSANDPERVADLIEKYAIQMLEQSQYNQLLSWIQVLPDYLVQQRPWLLIYRSWTQHWAGLRSGGEDYLNDAEILSQSTPISDEDKLIQQGFIATIRAHYALINRDITNVIEQAQKALRVLPEDNDYVRGTASIALGGALWARGDLIGAEKAFAKCVSHASLGGYHQKASSALCYQGMMQVRQSRLFDAQATFQQALAVSLGPGERHFPVSGYSLAKLGELHCEWNDLEQARHDADEAVRLCKQLGQVDLIAEAYAALAQVQLAQHDFPGLEETLEYAELILQRTVLDPFAVSWLDSCRIKLLLFKKKTNEAQQWLENRGLRLDTDISYHHDLHHLNLARVLIAQLQNNDQADFEKVAILLTRLLDRVNKAKWWHHKIQVLVLQALAFRAAGNHLEALRSLYDAIMLAKPADYQRVFIQEGEPLAEMLIQLCESQIPEQPGVQADDLAYIQKILTGLNLEITASQPGRNKKQELVEPLTPREVQVLRLLMTNLTVPEIAAELVVSASTVRTHVKHIYKKLNVDRRMSAVQKAQDLKLI